VNQKNTDSDDQKKEVCSLTNKSFDTKLTLPEP